MSRTPPITGVGVAGRATARAFPSLRRLRVAFLAASTLVLATAPMMTETATAAPTEKFSYTASAYGTSVSVGSVVKSGPSASVGLGCTTNNDIHRSNSTAGINLLPLAKSGSVSTTADTYAMPVRSSASATTAQVSLLAGLVRATSIKSVSSTTRVEGGFSLSSAGTTVADLVVAGVPVKADAAPNTRINLVGFGYLIVNEQIRRSNGLTVNGLHLFVTGVNALGLATGSNVVVSQAVSGLSGPVFGVLGGNAYGSYVKVGSAVSSGPSFEVTMPCLGSNGALRSNTGAGLTVSPLLKTGTITNTARGTVTASSSTGQTTSTVQGATVLNGVVKASAIKAVANASTDGSGEYVVNGTGSRFGALSVSGQPGITADVAPNTKVVLAGVGTLYLNRVIRTEKSVSVIMIQLVLTSPVNGLPVGTDIRVAVANASVG